MYQNVADISVFGLEGDIGDLEGRQLIRRLARLIRREWVKIVLDFERVEHINYQVMATLVAFSQTMQLFQGQIKLANMTPYHRNILRVAGVDEFFESYESLAEAILSFEDGYCSSAGPC